MPSLRDRSSTKRPSRTSSPFVRTADTSPVPTGDPKKERSQASLETWVEPPPRSPVPSFQEYGMERTPIFQDMAPLGSLPPIRLKFKVKSDQVQEKADSLPASDAATGTPERTPPVETRPAQQPSIETKEEAAQPEAKAMSSVKKEPVGSGATNGLAAALPPPPPSPSARNGTPIPPQTRQPPAMNSPKAAAPPSRPRKTQERPPNKRMDRMEKVVMKAIDLARSQGQEKLAMVIERFYQETHTDDALAVLFDAVITKQETAEQKEEFAIEMKRIKKAVRKEAAAPESRSRTIGTSIPPRGYSAQSPATTMRTPIISPDLTRQPISLPSHLNVHTGPLPPTSPQQASVPLRSSLQPSPFSANHAPSGIPSTAAIQSSRARPGLSQSPRNSVTQIPTTTPQLQSTPHSQPSTSKMVSTRRSAAKATALTPGPTSARGSVNPTQADPAASNSIDLTANGTETDAALNAPTTAIANGTKRTAANAKTNAKQATRSPKTGRTKRNRRSDSVESNSSLSSVDDTVINKGRTEPAENAAVGESQQPSRAGSRSGTPRPGAAPKGKNKKVSNLRNLAGAKRAASEAIPPEDIDDETRERRARARTNYDRELQERKAQEPEAEFSSFRDSDEYLSHVPLHAGESHIRRATRNQNAPSAGRRARESTQQQRAQFGDVFSNAPNFGPGTPSTPRDIDPSGESDGDPPEEEAPPKKKARTKNSPHKNSIGRKANGTTASRRPSPSRSSPSVEDGGREGKKPNRDQCFACGCGGQLVCCDMCQNSFHAECWDPPCTDSGDDPFVGAEWLCTHCKIFDRLKTNEERLRRGEPPLHSSEQESDDEETTLAQTVYDLNKKVLYEPLVFSGRLAQGLKSQLPSQYGLQPVIRDCYEGYTADVEERYEGIKKADIIVDGRARPSELMQDEGKQLKDPKDLKHCTFCGLTPISKKSDLIKCDTCNMFWHLDCLPEPTTAPPLTYSRIEKKGNRDVEVFKKRYWECPRHVDQAMTVQMDPKNHLELKERGIRARLPRRQAKFIADLKANQEQPPAAQIQPMNELPDDAPRVDIAVDDAWWDSYNTRLSDLKETGNVLYKVNENTIIAEFSKKARSRRAAAAKTNEEFIAAFVPNVHEAAELQAQWRERMRVEVQSQVDAATALASLGGPSSPPSSASNDLNAAPSDNDAVTRLADSMSEDQIKKMRLLLQKVSRRKQQTSTAALSPELQSDLDTMLASSRRESEGSEGDGERASKRRRTRTPSLSQ